jgi:hypothetical protein
VTAVTAIANVSCFVVRTRRNRHDQNADVRQLVHRASDRRSRRASASDRPCRDSRCVVARPLACALNSEANAICLRRPEQPPGRGDIRRTPARQSRSMAQVEGSGVATSPSYKLAAIRRVDVDGHRAVLGRKAPSSRSSSRRAFSMSCHVPHALTTPACAQARRLGLGRTENGPGRTVCTRGGEGDFSRRTFLFFRTVSY